MASKFIVSNEGAITGWICDVCLSTFAEKKTRAAYETLFQAVVGKCVELHVDVQVETVTTVSEDAVLNAVSDVLDDTCKFIVASII